MDHRNASADAATPDLVRDAFRELHGRHLHGFALLLMLGDAPRAAQLAVVALSEGVTRVDELRHPERAAAWLRSRVVQAARGMRSAPMRHAQRLQALAELGVDEPMLSSLAVLDRLERAALISSAVERLDRRDVAVVVGRDGAALDRLLARARRRYAAARANASDDILDGPLVDRVRAIASQAMA